MRGVRAASIGCVMLCMTSLLLGRVHPFGDAALYAPKAAPGPIMAHSSVPPDVRATLEAKCADCHSMQTRPYIYGRFAPVSWLMERDILEGRRQMNLSAWDTYSADQQLTFEAKIVREMKVRAMPLPQYRMIHWNARITDGDVLAFVRWARETPAFAPTPTAEESDPVRGEAGLREAVHRLPCDGGKSGRSTAARCLWANLRDGGRLCLLSSSRSRTHRME